MYHPGTRAMIDAGHLISGPEYLTALRLRTSLIRQLKELFTHERLDVLALSSLPGVASVAGQLSPDMVRGGPDSLTAYLHHQFLANVAGLPATSIPCASLADGLPAGLQVIGRPLAEHQLLRIAHLHEEAIHSDSGTPPPGARVTPPNEGADRS
jgi:aspartyl-tRNA(Asn)/glutamyl-tRNA(Gln) amidotransferase subunit A